MATSEQLARQASATREKLSRTIDELRLRTRPARLVDDVAGYLRQTGERLSPNSTARPSRSRYMFPLAIIGAGLTWLALEARRSERVTAARPPFDGKPAILPMAEAEVVATSSPPTIVPTATLRPVKSGSIAPEAAVPVPDELRRDNVDPGQPPLPL